MNDTRQPGSPHPPPHHPSSHPQAPQIHSAPPLRPTITPVAPHAPAPAGAGARPGIAPMPTGLRPPSEDELEPIELVEDEAELAAPVAPTGPTQLRTQQYGGQPVAQPAAQQVQAPKKIVALGADAHRAHHDWKRQPIKNGTGACRVRSFHGKYSEQGLEYLDNAVNEWLDAHPEVEVKFVTSTVMTFEGKIREPALVLNVWY
jgi:hypothetical protein